jgi:hypothetical protein
MRSLALLVVLALAACGRSNKPPTGDPVAAKQSQDGPAPAAKPSLSEAECTELFDHLAKLMQEGMPPDEWAAGKDELAAERDSVIKECQNGDTTRAQYECMMKAERLEQVKSCVPQT